MYTDESLEDRAAFLHNFTQAYVMGMAIYTTFYYIISGSAMALLPLACLTAPSFVVIWWKAEVRRQPLITDGYKKRVSIARSIFDISLHCVLAYYAIAAVRAGFTPESFTHVVIMALTYTVAAGASEISLPGDDLTSTPK